MKYFKIGFLLLAVVGVAYSQAPQSFNYQAILRNSDGTVYANETIALQISLIDDKGSSAYMEIHNTQTNQVGLVNVVVGKGTTSENLAMVDWSAGPYFLEITVNGVSMGSSPILSVPYAVYSGNAHSALSADKVRWMDIDELPTTLDGYGITDAIKSTPDINFINSLKKGDGVKTIGGIHGKIADVSEEYVMLEAADNVILKVDKISIRRKD